MNVVVLSMFRDATGYLSRYYQQLRQLDERLHGTGSKLRVVAIENDSLDETHFSLLHNLEQWPGSEVLRASDDCPYWPSVDRPERWRHIAWLCNQLLDRVRDNDDVILYVESDLIWDAREIKAVLDLVPIIGAATVPNYLKEKGGDYYDTWGSRRNGVRFERKPPYHEDWVKAPVALNVDCCASICAVRADIGTRFRFTDDEAFVGWTKQIAQSNVGGLKMLNDFAVVHP